MTLLLQLSDPHFGTEQPAVMDALASLVQPLRPDLLVLSGDITQRAGRRQFQAARAFVDRLGAPSLAIPGNHDIPLFNLGLRLWRPYARYREAFGEDLEPVHSTPGLLVLGVNTTRWWRHKNGAVSRQQVERVARRLARATPAQLRVVVVHQPVVVLRPGEAHNLLRGRAVALPRWASAGADLVLGGHIHLPYVSLLPGLPRPMWAVQAGTAVSWRVRDGVPNSVNLLRWGPGAPADHCRVERWDHDAQRRAFVLHGVTDLPLARRP